MRALVENPRLLILAIAFILVSGIAAVASLPRSEDPYMTGRTGVIITPFPGASAERVEALITEPLEEKIREIKELDYITSRSQAGMSTIVFYLQDHVKVEPAKLIWSRARDLMQEAAAQFPQGAGTPRLDENRSHAFTVLISIEWAGKGDPDALILGRYGDELASRLRTISGTDFVDSWGRAAEEISVSVDSKRLASAGLSTADVARAIQASDAKIAAGQLYNKQNRMSVELTGELADLETIRRVPLKINNGHLIRVNDIADVERGERNPPPELAYVEGKRAMVVGTRMIPTVRVDRWTQLVYDEVEAFDASLPANIKTDILFTQDDYTSIRLEELIGNILLGLALILIVLFLTLGVRAAIIVAASLPLTVMMTLSVMNYTGLTIQQMTMTGLIVALGIMVDNAIVMVDTIARERREGKGKVEAMLNAVQHLWLPLLGSTLTTILAFIPVAIMPGSAGEFVRGIPLGVIISLIGSYLISHTIIAGLAGRYLPDTENNSHWWHAGINFPIMASLFNRSLRWSLSKPWLSLLFACSLPFAGFALMKHLPEAFFPTSDRDMFRIEIFMPESASMDATRSMALAVNEHVKNVDGIEGAEWFVGSNAPAFYYNMLSSRRGAQNYAEGMITASHFTVANDLIPKLQEELDAAFPSAQILVRKLLQGPPITAPIEIRLYGPNLDTLKAYGNDLRRIMAQTPHVTHTRSGLSSTVPKMQVAIDEEQSLRSALPLNAVADQLRGSLDGIVRGSVIEATEEIPVRIRLQNNARENLSDLANIDLQAQLRSDKSYSGVPMSALAELSLTPGAGVIPRRDGQRVNEIEAYLEGGVLASNVLKNIQKNMDAAGFKLPHGYELEIGGESDARAEAVAKLLGNIGVIISLLVLVVVLSFNSFRMSSIIFATAILAAGLGLLSLLISGYPFGFTPIIALLGLIGLAINAAIVILAELRSDPAATRGDKQAILHGVQACSRHISSTTVTTFGGFLPLIIAGGGMWPPFAVTIAGGTLLCTIVSFYFVPAAFLLFARKRAFVAKIETPAEVQSAQSA